MIPSGLVFDELRSQGVTFFTGVPDSLLKHFCAYVEDHATGPSHVITANEGSAVALAIGHYLGVGTPALVYMQNSGFGNALNPLLSLADPEVYSVPMIVLVGWRGAPGVVDEPQHVKQGRIMESLLRALEIPYYVLPDEPGLVAEVVKSASKTATSDQTPVVVLANKGTFESYSSPSNPGLGPTMSREEAIGLVAEILGEQPLLVSTTGKASRELFEYRAAGGEGHHRDFLTVGGMGHASQIGMGLALATPDREVYCVDGDGALIMHMGALATIGAEASPNFKHIVLNNGAHDSVGGQPTAALGMDLPAIAMACGYRSAARADTKEELREELAELAAASGPSFLEVRVRRGARSDLGRPTVGPRENRDTLMMDLRRRGADAHD